MDIEACVRMGTEYGEQQQQLANKMQHYFQAFGEITVDKLAAFVAGYALSHPTEMREAVVEQLALSLVKGMQAGGLKIDSETDFISSIAVAARRRIPKLFAIKGGK